MNVDLNETKGLNEKLEHLQEAKKFLLGKISQIPEIAIVCGTGLGDLADTIENPIVFHYKDIPHFPRSTVPGHEGKLIFGILGGRQVVCMKGRVHGYEGHDMWKITFGIRVFSEIGIKTIIVTNASGGVNNKLNEGDVVILTDHINIPGMAGLNPLVGLNDERFGPRFQEMTTAYDAKLQELAHSSAKMLSMDFVKSGVYCYQFGPAFESPAEIKFLLNIGADVVGMSTVPEILVARHCRMRCLGVSLVTNMCVMEYNTKQMPNHEEVLEMGRKRACDLQKLITKIVSLIK